jgi:hypothetical protein
MTALLFTNLLAYTPFIQPLPGVWNYWAWLLLPLCIGVSVVYKAIKAPSMARVPIESTLITIYILLSMGAAAIALVVLVKVMS